MWAATNALNGTLATGVPTDWATHMIGHELTAMFGIDHAQTLAIVLPGVLTVLKEQKSEKLLHFAKNVWDIEGQDNDEVIDAAINKTEKFFNDLGIKTRLSDYEISKESILVICNRLKERKYVKLGESKNINPKMVKTILNNRF